MSSGLETIARQVSLIAAQVDRNYAATQSSLRDCFDIARESRATLTAMESQVERLWLKLDDLHSRTADLEARIDQVSDEVTELSSIVRQLDDDVKALRDDVDALSGEVSALRWDFDYLQYHVDNQFQTIWWALEDMAGEISAAQSDIEDLYDYCAELDDTFGRWCSDLEDWCRDLDDRVSELEGKDP